MTTILINGAAVSHAGNDVVDDITLSIGDQKLMAVIGPSENGRFCSFGQQLASKRRNVEKSPSEMRT